ncbi:MAG: glycosyltransferase family 4 protein [Candidatus Yonathbacteria bacterium]|nr:glycosyltransferase family 4 protein [Candidatus Yonathbacteria bacterium]
MTTHLLVIAVSSDTGAEETLAERLSVYAGIADTMDVIVPGGVDDTHMCRGRVHKIPQGRSSWRFLWRIVCTGKIVFPRIASGTNDKRLIVVEGVGIGVIAGTYLARIRKVPVEIVCDRVHVHGETGESRGILEGVVVRALARASGVRVPSRRVRNLFVERYPLAPQPIVLSFPVTMSDERRVHDAELVLGYAPDSSAQGTLLTAWRHIVNRYPRMRLTMMTGNALETSALVHRVGLGDSVSCIDADEKEVSSAYASAAYAIHAPVTAPVGKQLIRMVRAGIPSVTTDTGIVGDLLTGNDVLVCPPGDGSCIAKQILFLLDNPQVCASLIASTLRSAHTLPRAITDARRHADTLKSLWMSYR